MRLLAAGVILCACLAPAAAIDYAAERAACEGDVVVYCWSEIGSFRQPNVEKIAACLQRNRARISEACRKMLDKHAGK
jgi:hypothetical protein